MLLVNALSFEGAWSTPFDPSLTTMKEFYVHGDENVKKFVLLFFICLFCLPRFDKRVESYLLVFGFVQDSCEQKLC
jgi:hypothetical protein